ncbi:MAG: SGNH/GDSL hydrolase family protein [Methylocystis sp.]|uniref:SGNH/GDSL hydrolase family protein n=1 Tax=Methylocystis sp. TaxID=1911079 RepID=UPI003935F3BF
MIGRISICWREPLRLLLVNLGILAALYLIAEIALHLYSSAANPLLGAGTFRVRHPAFHHGLKPNFEGSEGWIKDVYPYRINSLGFRDAAAREAPLAVDRRRILFIGDSFTEGLGLPYEQTFVGRFAAAFPELDVLNAGVTSYAPSAYYEKIKYFLSKGLKVDEVFVYIDISDIQDEALSYYYDERGVLQWKTDACSPTEPLWSEKPLWKRAFYVAEFADLFFEKRKLAELIDKASLTALSQSGYIYSRDWPRPSWTYDPADSCFGALGVEGGIRKAKERMDRLHELLAANGIPLSVGVYPWPQQLLYDEENSRQVRIWRDWCAGKCRRFLNHFPAFFEAKRSDPDFVRNLFIWGDVHYSARGNEIVADGLIKAFRAEAF